MKQNVKWNTSRQVTHRLPTLWERQNILAGQQVLKLHPNIEGETANHTWLSFLYTSAPPKKIEGKKERQRKKEKKRRGEIGSMEKGLVLGLRPGQKIQSVLCIHGFPIHRLNMLEIANIWKKSQKVPQTKTGICHTPSTTLSLWQWMMWGQTLLESPCKCQ